MRGRYPAMTACTPCWLLLLLNGWLLSFRTRLNMDGHGADTSANLGPLETDRSNPPQTLSPATARQSGLQGELPSDTGASLSEILSLRTARLTFFARPRRNRG
jgi:hypothetical protein